MPRQILPKINYESTARAISGFLKREFKKRKKPIAIVGVSGGVDSALASELCQMAGLRVKRIFMPYLPAGRQGGKISKSPDGYFLKINITNPVDILAGSASDKIGKGNIMARVRMIALYDLARKLNGLVVGTENLSEYYLGYFTRYGDQACDINPIGSLWKTQLIELAKYLGLAVRTPSAELWEGQTDEKELGFSYEEADPILYLYCVKKINPEKIMKILDLSTNLVYKVVSRVKDTQYKRERIPQYGKK